MKFHLYAIILLSIILIFPSCAKKNEAKDAPPEIKEVKPERGPIELVVASTGRVVSNLDVEIKCKASGEIVSLPFDVSDNVVKGDLVVVLDPIDEQRNVRKSEVAVLQAKARLDKTKQTLNIAESDLDTARRKAQIALDVAKDKAVDARAKSDRIKEMYAQKLASLEELETSETSASSADANLESAQIAIEELESDEKSLLLKREDVSLAQADHESAQINLSIAEQKLEDTKVYSPITGVVTQRDVQTGQIISSGISNVGGGTTVMTLSDLSRIFILASVDESDIGSVAEGQKVSITADAYSDKMFEGVVERIAQKGANTSNVVTFEVRIEVLSENKNLLKPEMTANVDIISAKKDEALLIPAGALMKIRGKYYVNVKNGDPEGERREIVIGINNGDKAEVISGLTESDTLLVRSTLQSQWNSQAGGPPPGARMMMGGGRR